MKLLVLATSDLLVLNVSELFLLAEEKEAEVRPSGEDIGERAEAN